MSDRHDFSLTRSRAASRQKSTGYCRWRPKPSQTLATQGRHLGLQTTDDALIKIINGQCPRQTKFGGSTARCQGPVPRPEKGERNGLPRLTSRLGLDPRIR